MGRVGGYLPVRILIADDQELILKVLRVLIERHADWQVCGEAKDGREAVVKAMQLKPDVIILDLAMPIMDGVRAAREISRAMPALPILMHTMHSSETLALEAKKAGVRQIVTKGDSGDDLLMAIERVLLETPQPGAASDAGTQATLDSMTPMIEKSNDVSTPVRDSDATGKSD